MSAKERLERFYGDRREVLMAVSLGPSDWAFCVTRTRPDRYHATQIHESVVRGDREPRGGRYEKDFDNVQEAAFCANRWYREEAGRSLD